MRNLTVADFGVLWPHAPAPLISGIIAAQDAIYARYGITRDIRLAMMWAMFSEETGAGLEMTESLDYSADALLGQWPNHFSRAQANLYGRTSDHPANQPAIGDLAYGGRMGNAPVPSPDGYNYRGRGLIQTTGRDGYAALAKETGLDLIGNPEMVNDPAHALLCGVAEFANYPGILGLCDAGDVLRVCRLINGGEIGLAERQAWFMRWREHLGL